MQLLPQSDYLSGRWWHRVAILLIAAWAAFVAYMLVQYLFVRPFDICAHRWGRSPEDVRDMCGVNAVEYFLMGRIALVELTRLAEGLLLFGAAVWMAVAIYRVFLAVLVGNKWKG